MTANDASAWIREALQLLAARRWMDARKLAERALATDDLDADAPPDERGITYDKPQRSLGHYIVGSVLIEMGDPRGAIAELDKALRYDPSDKVSLSNRAIAKRDLGDADGALADFGLALARDARYAHARANRARLHATRGELEQADQDYVALLALAPDPGHRAEWVAVRERRGLPHDDAAYAASVQQLGIRPGGR